MWIFNAGKSRPRCVGTFSLYVRNVLVASVRRGIAALFVSIQTCAHFIVVQQNVTLLLVRLIIHVSSSSSSSSVNSERRSLTSEFSS